MNMQVFLEWFHRLDAFLVGVALLVLFGVSVWGRHRLPLWLPWLTGLALALVGLQGALGALTVTHLLASSTVTAHLATALLLVWLLSGLDQGLEQGEPIPPLPGWWYPVPLIASALVLAQCVLGGAMASQWAVDHCLSMGADCEWLLRHRQLAMPAALSVVFTALLSMIAARSDRRMRLFALSGATLVGLQVALGILALRWQLQSPSLTIAHQLVAALLMAHLGALSGRTLHAWFQRPASPSLEVSCG